jgi:hypothetical protein
MAGLGRENLVVKVARISVALCTNYWLLALIGALIAFGPLLAFAPGSAVAGWPFFWFLFALSCIPALLFVVAMASAGAGLDVLRRLPRNRYGLCAGSSNGKPDEAGVPAAQAGRSADPARRADELELSLPAQRRAALRGGRHQANDTGRFELECCWFSDGGLTSNFPIHFFDAPLPLRPTFGIDLVPASVAMGDVSEDKRAVTGLRPGGEPIEQTAEGCWKSIYMPGTNASGIGSAARFDKFTSIGGFFSALFDTARNWADTELMAMPGYRDRIVHIALSEDEGGLNLNMPSGLIEDLGERGKCAGELLAARFDPDPGNDPQTGTPGRTHLGQSSLGSLPLPSWPDWSASRGAFTRHGTIRRNRSPGAATTSCCSVSGMTSRRAIRCRGRPSMSLRFPSQAICRLGCELDDPRSDFQSWKRPPRKAARRGPSRSCA